MSIESGKLRHRVRIMEPVETRDPVTGAVITTPQLVAEVWAAIEPLSVREFLQAGAMQSAIAGKAVIRYRAGLRSNMWLEHNGQVLNPAGWLPDKDSGLEYLTAPYTLGDNLRD